MSVIPLEKSPFSLHFNVLTYLGAWLYKSSNPMITNAYILYKLFMFGGASYLVYLQWVKFYLILGDMKKMTWNLCIVSLLMWGLLKYSCMVYRTQVINRLRWKLHRMSTSRVTRDDERLNRRCERWLRRVEIVFYSAIVCFIPLWIISWYFFESGERDLPVQIWIPFDVDLEDDLMFNIMFLVTAVGGTLSVVFVIAVELAMFTILIQISREYDRLIWDFKKINILYEDSGMGVGRVKTSPREMDPRLREIKTKMLLKELSVRQQNLIEYTKDFELIYSFTMLVQFFGSSVLFVFCAALAMMEYDNLSINISYQLGYLFLILMDMFFLSWFATQIRSQCYEVGDAAYSLFWYRMGVDIQKDICMIIRRSQNPPKITSGKFVEVDLHAFMLLIRNIYSWLTLMEQIAFKGN